MQGVEDKIHKKIKYSGRGKVYFSTDFVKYGNSESVTKALSSLNKKGALIRLTDEFSNDNNVKTQGKFLPIVEEFNRNYLNATSNGNKRNETNAITVFSKKIQKLMLDANQDLLRIKQETNIIRLIASDAVLQKLDLLTLAYDNSMEVSNKTMNYFL